MIKPLKRNNFTASLPALPAVAPQPPTLATAKKSAPKATPTLHEAEITARAFRLNYGILAGALLPLTIAIAAVLEFESAFDWLLLYSLMSVAGYWWLHRRHYPAPARPIVQTGAPEPAVAPIDDPALAKAVAQVARHSRPQSTSNLLANYVPLADSEVNHFDAEELAPPAFMAVDVTDNAPADAYVDVVREAVLSLLVKLYKQADGAFVNVKPDGTLSDGVIVPWSKRGGLTEAQRRQALDLLDQVQRIGGWLMRYDDTLRKWKLNLSLYSNFDAACEILDKCPTRVI